MLAQKIKQLRLANGWTLDELVARIGGVVTKQAISKYELGLSRPSAQVLTKIANVFNVKTMQLLVEPKYRIELIAYRKRLGLGKKEETRIENFARESLEERLKVQNLTFPNADIKIPLRRFAVNQLEDAEKVADKVRTEWNLGKDQILSVTSLLEDHLVHVLEVDANDKFDGMAVVAYENSNIKGVAIVVRKGTAGERNRLNLAHELGHLVLEKPKSMDEEKAAFRFGSAFLAPREWVLREVGKKRVAIDIQELIILKKKLGMSLQAIMYRLKDLDIISESYYSHWFKCINRLGWKKLEPYPIPVEKSEWLKQNVYKAFAENLLGQKDAEAILRESIDDKTPLSLKKIRSFIQLPAEERKRLLAEQAEKISSYYENDKSRDAWQAGDFLE